jgi:hypothetical protein
MKRQNDNHVFNAKIHGYEIKVPQLNTPKAPKQSTEHDSTINQAFEKLKAKKAGLHGR